MGVPDDSFITNGENYHPIADRDTLCMKCVFVMYKMHNKIYILYTDLHTIKKLNIFDLLFINFTKQSECCHQFKT